MDHDTGFAPHIENHICTLSGCKKTTIEVWAKPGSWVIGIGGIKTSKPDKMIYVMEVSENLLYREFKKRYSEISEYFFRYENGKSGSHVLVSMKFYYFGDNAISLPENLKHIIHSTEGCKTVTDIDIKILKDFLLNRYQDYGVKGKPNNPMKIQSRKKC